jgi:hypothetical protein
MRWPAGAERFPRAAVSKRQWLAVVSLGIALTAVLTYPTVRYFGTVGRFDTGDGRFSIWNVAWIAHALIDDPRHLLDANIFYPHRHTLTYSEMNLVAGTLATPVYAVTRSAVAAHNSAVFLGLLGAFIAMWALVYRLTASFWSAAASATAYTFSAFTASHTAQIQLLMFFGFPLVMLAFHDLDRTATVRSGVWLGIALSITGLSCGYYGVYSGGLTALVAVVFARPQRRYWMALGAAALTTGLVIGPVVLVYERIRAAEGAVRAPTQQMLDTYSANLSAYLTSGTIVQTKVLGAIKTGLGSVSPALVPGPASEVLFPGLMVIVFAIVGVVVGLSSTEWRRLTLGYVAVALFAAWASFGPRAGLYSLFERWLPGMSLLRAPARSGIVVIFALAVLAGSGLAALVRRKQWTGPVVVGLLVAELWVPWPLQAWPTESSAYTLLASLPRGGVVEFPFPYISGNFHEHTKAMTRSMRNWQPLLNGYSDHVPDDFYELALPVNAFPDPQSFAILRKHDIRYVIVRVRDYGNGEYGTALVNRYPPYEKYLRRLVEDQGVWLFEIVSWPE